MTPKFTEKTTTAAEWRLTLVSIQQQLKKTVSHEPRIFTL